MKPNQHSYIRIVTWVIIPLVLIFLWFLSVLFINPYGSFTTLVYPHGTNTFLSIPKQNIFTKGSEIIGSFRGDENNLGIIAVKMSKNLSGQVDVHHQLLFRVRESNSKNWFFQKEYAIDSIRENGYIFFGLPKITDSKGKQYRFEIISLNGDSTNATVLLLSNDSVITKYIYTKSELIKDRRLLMYISYRKLISTLLYPQAFFSSTILLLPFIYYILFLFLYDSKLARILFIYKKISFSSSNVIKNNNATRFFSKQISKTFFGGFTVTLIFADIFLLQDIYYGVAIGLYGFWIITVIRDGLSYKTSLLWSIIFLSLSMLFIPLDFVFMENNASMWGYLFLIIATVQVVSQQIRNNKHSL